MMSNLTSFNMSIQWCKAVPSGTAYEATDGYIQLKVDDHLIWENIQWNWVDFLAFLAENWIFLESELVNPIDLNNDEQLFTFNYHHNLSFALEGKYVPSVCLLRDGNDMIVSGDGFCITTNHQLVMDKLDVICKEIYGRLKSCGDAISIERMREWDGRYNRYIV